MVIHTRVYNLIDKLNYLRAEKYSLSFLHREITKINLPEEIKQVKIPIIFFHGTGDYQVPISVAKKYYEIISAPYKNFIEFQSCAHGLLIEKPEEFKDKLLSEIKKIENIKRKFTL